MFLANLWANLISGIILPFFKHKKEDAKLKQETSNKQKNKGGQNIVQNIGIQHIHYHQYYIDPKEIPLSRTKDTNITGTAHSGDE